MWSICGQSGKGKHTLARLREDKFQELRNILYHIFTLFVSNLFLDVIKHCILVKPVRVSECFKLAVCPAAFFNYTLISGLANPSRLWSPAKMNRSFFGFLGLSFVYIAAGGRGWRTLKRQRGLHRDDAAPFFGSSKSYSSFASSEVKGVKGVIAPYGRWGVKTTVFLAYLFKQKDICLNSLTPLTPLTSWYAKVQ